MSLRFLLAAPAFVLFLAVAQAAAPASDNASNSPYAPANTWSNTQNGGSGFSGWTLASGANSGFFIGSSSANGAGNTGNIDAAGLAWGMFANSGDTAVAIRPFTAGGSNNIAQLAIGQSFSLSMDSGFTQTGGSVGFTLQNGAGLDRFSFFYLGGDAVDSYKITVNSTTYNLGIPFTADGFSKITFTLGPSNAWALAVTLNGGGTTTFTDANFAALSASNITRVRLFNSNAGNGTSNNVYFNNVSIDAVPEPSTLMLLASVFVVTAGTFLGRRFGK